MMKNMLRNTGVGRVHSKGSEKVILSSPVEVAVHFSCIGAALELHTLIGRIHDFIYLEFAFGSIIDSLCLGGQEAAFKAMQRFFLFFFCGGLR